MKRTESTTSYKMNRRESMAALTAIGIASSTGLSRALAGNESFKRIHVFTKPIQSLSFTEVAALMEKWDVGGLEATVRAGGWIEPSNAAEQLPKLMDALRKSGRDGMILTSDINKASDIDIKRVLEPAAALGIRNLRTAYYKYDFNKKILPQLEQFAQQARGLAEVCRDLKMTAMYQNHAGATNVGAPLWDLMEVLRDIDPKQMCIALDIRHATIESNEAWRSSYARVREHVGAVFAKDAIMTNGKPDDGPLGRNPKCKQLFDLIAKDHPNLPISLHMEHIDHRPDDLLAKRLDAIAADVKTLQGWLSV